jgi:tRNA/rRNA methyltransferase
MGLGGLTLVRPQRWDPEKMCALATRLGQDLILEKVELAPDLPAALAGFGVVVGTSARLGRFRRPAGPPRSLLPLLAPRLASNRLALVFGPEKDGLANAEVELCHHLVTIPASERASSLNLAQAVLVLAYELRLAALDLAPNPAAAEERLADAASREGMFSHLRAVMDKLDPEGRFNRRVWLGAFRRLFARTQLLPHEVRLIRGLCRKICWAVDHRESGWEDLGDSPDRAAAG